MRLLGVCGCCSSPAAPSTRSGPAGAAAEAFTSDGKVAEATKRGTASPPRSRCVMGEEVATVAKVRGTCEADDDDVYEEAIACLPSLHSSPTRSRDNCCDGNGAGKSGNEPEDAPGDDAPGSRGESDSSDQPDQPLATECSIPPELTKLHALHMDDCLREVSIIVPEGVRGDRKVRVDMKGTMWEVEVPEEAEPGEQVPVLLPSAQAPLEHWQLRRIWHEVRWPLRWKKEEGACAAEDVWSCDEVRRENRLVLYRAMRGGSMDPMLHPIRESDDC